MQDMFDILGNFLFCWDLNAKIDTTQIFRC